MNKWAYKNIFVDPKAFQSLKWLGPKIPYIDQPELYPKLVHLLLHCCRLPLIYWSIGRLPTDRMIGNIQINEKSFIDATLPQGNYTIRLWAFGCWYSENFLWMGIIILQMPSSPNFSNFLVQPSIYNAKSWIFWKVKSDILNAEILKFY